MPRFSPALQDTPFLAREPELATIAAAARRAREGRPVAVALVGEAGVGKTRLIAEAAAPLAAEGRLVVRSGAIAQTGAHAYLPITRAVNALLLARPELRSDAAGAVAVLERAGVTPRRSPGDTDLGAIAADDGRRLVCEAFTELLCITREELLVLAFDDLQWAAPVAWEALGAALRDADGRVLALLGMRDDGGGTGGDAARFALAELHRRRRLVRCELPPLPLRSVEALVEAALGRPAPDGLVSFLFESTGGVPYFVEDLLQAVQQSPALHQSEGASVFDANAARGLLAGTARFALQERLARLPPGVLEALTAAAVLGRQFHTPDLAAMLGADRDRIDALLGEARGQGLVLREEPALSAFRHDLIREAFLDLAGGRPSLHARAARALSANMGMVPNYDALSRVAYHWQMAGEPLESCRASIAAARAVLALGRSAEALDHARNARGAADRIAPVAHEAVAASLVHGEAAMAEAQYEEAQEAFALAVAAAKLLDEGPSEALAELQLGRVLRRREQPALAASHLARARALAPGPHELAESLIELAGLEGVTLARYGSADALAREALQIAVELPDPLLEARAALALANVTARSAGPAAARPLLVRTLDLAAAAGDLALAAETAASLSNGCYWTGELTLAQAYADRRLEAATAAHDLFGLRHAHSWLALLACSRGDWARASALLDAAEPALARLASPEPLAFVRLVRALMALRRDQAQLAYQQARAAIDALAPLGPDSIAWYAGLLVQGCLAAGREAEARREIEAQEARLAAMPESALPARSARAALAFAYVGLGMRPEGAACERALRPYAEDFHWSPVRRSLAALAALRGDTATALADIDAAEGLARREGLLPDVGLALLQRAALLPAGSEERRLSVGEARDLFTMLGMPGALRELEALSPVAQRAAFPAGLTAREVEVLHLVAAGRTNREIAEALVLSERTVVNHISHIFDKTGVDNRAGAASFAHRHGLADS